MESVADNNSRLSRRVVFPYLIHVRILPAHNRITIFIFIREESTPAECILKLDHLYDIIL